MDEQSANEGDAPSMYNTTLGHISGNDNHFDGDGDDNVDKNDASVVDVVNSEDDGLECCKSGDGDKGYGMDDHNGNGGSADYDGWGGCIDL